MKLIRHDVQAGAAHEQLVRRFQREAQVTAGLRSPHTVQLYDFGVNDSGSFYYVMELLEGLDLHRIVTRFGPQPAERVIMLLRQACRSLAEAHEHGLVHRDIKPANLFVTGLGLEYDYLKVLDFGIVKDQPGQDATMLSEQGILQGTPAFMAPELVFGESRIDGRADLYSLACSAYWALTGQLLFQASTPAQMLLHHAADAAGAAVAGLGASHSGRVRGHPHDVSREGSREAAVVGARARFAAGARPVQGALDRGAGAGVVGDACPGPRGTKAFLVHLSRCARTLHRHEAATRNMCAAPFSSFT